MQTSKIDKVAEIRYIAYANSTEYRNGTNGAEKPILLDWGDLARYSLNMGDYTGHLVSFFGWLSYFSPIAAALMQDQGYYRASQFYISEEPSFKSVLSFKLGMLAARIVSEEIYEFPHLIHMTDKRLSVTPSNTYHPDYCALQNNQKCMLFEAKGTGSERIPPSKIDHAQTQLKTIRTVTYDGNLPVSPQERRVICSCFSNSGDLTYYDIDPIGQGTIDLSFDIDRAMYLYYFNWIQLLLQNASNGTKQEEHRGISYEMFDIAPFIRCGVQKDLFELLSSKSMQTKECIEYHKIQEALESIPNKLEKSVQRERGEGKLSVSQGLDGLLVEVPYSANQMTSEIPNRLNTLHQSHLFMGDDS